MIHVGTAGWSYPTGKGKWSGVFYPRGSKVDPLSFYARFFDIVEVNSSFYRPVQPAVARAWAEKTPKGFTFAVKLYQKFTHPKLFEEATGNEPKLKRADFGTFEAGIEPLVEAGKLGPLLAQFPSSFKRDDAAVEHLEDLLERFGRYQVAVELRHPSWTEDATMAKLLKDFGASWVHIDEPKFKSRIRDIPNVGAFAYFRFHGRNYKDWWKGDKDARYNYLYSPEEQAELAEQIAEVTKAVRSAHVIYNNHYGGKAVANALEMRTILGQRIEADVPESLLSEFPGLARLLAAPRDAD